MFDYSFVCGPIKEKGGIFSESEEEEENRVDPDQKEESIHSRRNSELDARKRDIAWEDWERSHWYNKYYHFSDAVGDAWGSLGKNNGWMTRK